MTDENRAPPIDRLKYLRRSVPDDFDPAAPFLIDPWNLGLVISSVLGSTEGTYYGISLGSVYDIRYDAVVSTGRSGLSFGMFQFDVAHNATARTLFAAILANAVRAEML